jgi:hypothetical protein
MQQEIISFPASGAASSALERRGVQNHEGFFAPYYLFELLERRHAAELDLPGGELPRITLRRLFRRVERIALAGASLSFERVWALWYRELFKTLGFPSLRRLEPLETIRHGLVPISHACYTEENGDNPDDPPLIFIDLHPLGIDLDRAHYPNPTRNPHMTREPISRAFELALDDSQTRWALLSNGLELRLYRRDSSVARQYLSIHFVELFEHDHPKEWLVFWGLFRFAAFTARNQLNLNRQFPLLSTSHECLLDRVNKGSQQHTVKIADDLRENVVAALENLLQGIIDSPQNLHLWQEIHHGKSVPGEKQLKVLFDEGIKFLYRLLFILYAESRDLLPVGESIIYKDTYSLEHLRDMVERPLRSEDYDKTYYSKTIYTLFQLLYQGYPIRNPRVTSFLSIQRAKETAAFSIPPYNGTLFKPDQTPLLDMCFISDRTMREVIRELSLSRPKRRSERRERYSYADLGIDQLGSIYEGLLVYEPSITDQAMVEARIKGELHLVPLEQAESLRVSYDQSSVKPAGSFVLRIWGGRRKSSGSYYTPQEITAFLVKDSLVPLVEPIIQGCSQRGRDSKPRRHAEEILQIKVCDPAMGSGAFLVQACRYLGEAYGRALTAEGLREDKRMEADELARYKRRVAETCLYGVDVNPLAVELAKISLWLETLAQDRPLTFLDAHLRCGNALIGAPLRDQSGQLLKDLTRLSMIPTKAFGKASKEDTKKFKDQLRKLVAENKKQVQQFEAGQLNLFSIKEVKHILAAYLHLRLQLEESDEGKTIEEAVELVHHKHDLFQIALEDDASQLHRLKQVCDLWCAVWFWPSAAPVLPPTTLLYQAIASLMLSVPHHHVPDNAELYRTMAQSIAKKLLFFHWELEFPEIWFDEQGDPLTDGGFDVVVGNPPWSKLAPLSKEFWSNYAPTFRKLGKQAAIRETQKLRSDPEIDISWRNYCKFIEQQNNIFRLGGFFTTQGRGQLNTYKLFLEQMIHITKHEGIFSIVVPSGIYTDAESKPLREHLFTEQKSRFLISIENRRGIFPIHRSTKVVLLSGQKSQETKRDNHSVPIGCLFLVGQDTRGQDLAPSRQDLGLLLPQVELHLLKISPQTIKTFAPDTFSLMEFKSQHEIHLAEHIYNSHPLLGDKLEDSWNISFQQDFHMTNDSDLFEEEPTGWPLWEGKMIYQYARDYSSPDYWINEHAGLARLSRRAKLNSFSVAKQWQANQPKLGCTDFRLVYRSVARNTDEATLIATILPPKVFATNSLSEVTQWIFHLKPDPHWEPLFNESNQFYLLAILNSFVLNFVIRQKVTANVNQYIVEQLPVPRLPFSHFISQSLAPLAARLTCVDERFAPLWEEVARYHPRSMAASWSPECGARSARERALLRAQIDTIVADLYGLSAYDFAYILSTFPLLDRDQPPLTGERQSTITRDLALLTFFRLRNQRPPEDIVSFFREAGVSILNITGSVICLTERVSIAMQDLGAIAYQPSGKEKEEYREAAQLADQDAFDFEDADDEN